MADDEVLPKPGELLAVHEVSEELFGTLKRWFDVPDRVSLDLTDIDAATREMGDPVMIAALAMRKLQALHLLALPGVRTTTDVVVTVVQDLDRALVQAPVMHLRHQAEQTDWDAAFAALTDEVTHDAPHAADDDDAEVTRFRQLHVALHHAARAVVEASEGEIRVFE